MNQPTEEQFSAAFTELCCAYESPSARFARTTVICPDAAAQDLPAVFYQWVLSDVMCLPGAVTEELRVRSGFRSQRVFIDLTTGCGPITRE